MGEVRDGEKSSGRRRSKAKKENINENNLDHITTSRKRNEEYPQKSDPMASTTYNTC